MAKNRPLRVSRKQQKQPYGSAVIAAKLQQALAHHQRGQLAQAAPLYREILAKAPTHFDALHLFGVLQYQNGQHQAAVESIQKAIRVNPKQPSAYSNLGLALKELNKFEEALASYDRALALKPDYAEAHNNRGNALQDLKRLEDALASYERALALKPDYAEAHHNRGNALQNLKRYDDALASYERALALKPDYAEAHHNRGNALQNLKRHDDALVSYERALALRPDYAEALNNRGNVLQNLKRHDDALASYERALALRPDYAEALNNCGNVLVRVKRHGDALASYERALALRPDYADALNNRGNTLRELKHYDDAAKSFARLITLAPDYDYAIGNLLDCQLQRCDWEMLPQLTRAVTDAVERGQRAVAPFVFLATSQSSAAQLQCSRTHVADQYPVSPKPMWTGQRYRHDRIRLAYLSADFREHAMAFLMAGLFERHDKARFETTAVSFGPDTSDAMRLRLKKAFERFIDVRQQNDRDVADLLRKLEIDVAVDLMGFTTDARTGIFALRPVPIQVNYLGYPGTMGADYIDYIFADRFVVPEDQQMHYLEKVIYLTDTFQANDSKRQTAARTPSRAEVGLPQQGFVFCSFNNSYKITPVVFGAWMRLLHQIEGSVLWLLGGNASVEANLRREAAVRGVDSARLVFAPPLQYAEHLARYRLADLFLDTLPYNAGATASDALSEALPVLTCSGEAFAARMAGSLLHAIGLPELITHSLEEYESLGMKLATQPTLLTEIKERLSRNRKTYPLFDTDRFRRHIEAAYIEMWERGQRGEPPKTIRLDNERSSI